MVPLAENAKATTVACGTVESICDTNGDWFNRQTARSYYSNVWDVLELAMEKSRQESGSIPDSDKMMDFFRQEVERRSRNTPDPTSYRTSLLHIVEMWGAFMGDDCEKQSLKNLWLDSSLEGGRVFTLQVYDAFSITHD